MKFSLKFSAFLLSLLCVLSSIGTFAFAKDNDKIVSPALAVLSGKNVMTVTGMSSSPASFSAADFDFHSGVSVDKIRILTLPDENEGTLYLGNTPVSANQSVSRKNFSKLVFKPVSTSADATFYFTVNGDYATECHVMVLENVNLAPVISESATALETMKGISVHGSLTASDPEGDTLDFYVTKAPKKGSVAILNGGSFVYTPNENKKGADSFSVCAVDEYGNRSAPVSVKININKNSSGVKYTDLEGHWAHTAAIKMTDSGVMKGEYVDGDAYFYPTEKVSREEFVTMLMKTIGLSDIAEIQTVVFADDGEISDEARNYCRAAEKLGFINGTSDGDKVYFNPTSTITRAEVAVILQNIIGVEVDSAVPVFADNESIPAWAAESVLAMRQIGIMNGTGGGAFSPFSTLTRAEVASILSAVSEMVV